ncbi:MAG: HAD-IIIC family phosphatase [Deltaproteobacteria bacterium]|nr:HAD-IIIC family phosphatase [Deltaproteobacteria bacterium]
MIPPRLKPLDDAALESLAAARKPELWAQLRARTRAAATLEELLFLSNLRKKAAESGLAPEVAKPNPLRLAVVGGYTLFPFHEALEHLLSVEGFQAELFVGDYDNYESEILNPVSLLYAFKPDIIFVLPSDRRCRYTGSLLDAREAQQAAVDETVRGLLALCATAHERTKAELVVANFRLSGRFELGPYRARSLGNDWSFRRAVNTGLGLRAPAFVHVCDAEFTAARRGNLSSEDQRGWLQSKQPGSPEYQLELAREAAHVIGSLRKSPKKVLVCDLDNTLWGGVIGDDGLDGIELGDTSARGQAYKELQKYILSLYERGVLLAVVSKNDHEKAIEPFEKHPEMVLKPRHFAAFKANWRPKSDNLKELATELALGLDSFVFIDDNPAEIDIVRQFTPEVTTILMGPKPADYLALLQDCRLFEPVSITAEDTGRTEQYRAEAQRKTLQESVTDMDAFLASLEMQATIAPFRDVDVPRIAQLINKSNQFNLTTRRRTEGEVEELARSRNHECFTIRLADKFGDYGLIAVLVAEVRGKAMEIDTWLMSCRVLNRQVEEETMNEVFSRAHARGCEKVVGRYRATSKNGMVRDVYERLGFKAVSSTAEESVFERETAAHKRVKTRVWIEQKR